MPGPKRATFCECARLIFLDGAGTRLCKTRGTRAVRAACWPLALAALYACWKIWPGWWLRAQERASFLCALQIAALALVALALAALAAAAACWAFGLYGASAHARYLPAEHAHPLAPRAAWKAAQVNDLSVAERALCAECGQEVLVLWDVRCKALRDGVTALVILALWWWALIADDARASGASQAWLLRLAVFALLGALCSIWPRLGADRMIAARLGWYSVVRENPEWEG